MTLDAGKITAGATPIDAVIAQLEEHVKQCGLEVGVCPDPSAHALLEVNRSIQWMARETRRTMYPLARTFTTPPPAPLVSETTVFVVAFAAMAGALLGWLAPVTVSGSIIALLILASWYERTDPLAGQSACVHRMMRRW